jgi:alkanesulfonate monooxygenase SsuD/methylene tetrahydromethanopterin reductase-like flavin-dependent oxidoreductase (luciferase family)
MIKGADVLTFGLKASQQHTPIDTLQQVWKIADEGGFDSCWVFDHFAAMGRDRGGDIFEAWTLLGAMAQATRRIRIGCMVTGNSHRHPGILAKMAVTVDHLSAGRLDMGLGAGGDELVHGMLGIPLGPPRERVERLAEACEVLELLWTEPVASFSGRYYRLDQAVANPKPVQRPHPPLWIGAVGERRSLRVVARHAAAWTPSLLPARPWRSWSGSRACSTAAARRSAATRPRSAAPPSSASRRTPTRPCARPRAWCESASPT